MILGPLTLSDHLILDGLETAAPVVHSYRRLIGGAGVLQTDGNQGGRVLRLVSIKHLELAEVVAIQGLVAARQPITIVHHRGTFTVLIIETNVEPDRQRANPTADEWYSGEIVLQEI
jgi:hypothetical protein